MDKLPNLGSPWDSESLAITLLGPSESSVQSYAQGVNSDGRASIGDRVLLYEGSPQYIIVQLGGNDFSYHNSAVFSNNYNLVIDDLIAKIEKKVQVFIMNIPWSDYSVLETTNTFRTIELHESYNEVVSQIASDYELTLIDIWGPLIGHPEYLANDGNHLSDLGATFVASIIDDQIGEKITIRSSNDKTPIDINLVRISLLFVSLIVKKKRFRISLS